MPAGRPSRYEELVSAGVIHPPKQPRDIADIRARLEAVHLLVDDIASDVERLTQAGVAFRSGIVTGPGGSQIVLDDPSGNPIELFQPAAHPTTR